MKIYIKGTIYTVIVQTQHISWFLYEELTRITFRKCDYYNSGSSDSWTTKYWSIKPGWLVHAQLMVRGLIVLCVGLELGLSWNLGYWITNFEWIVHWKYRQESKICSGKTHGHYILATIKCIVGVSKLNWKEFSDNLSYCPLKKKQRNKGKCHHSSSVPSHSKSVEFSTGLRISNGRLVSFPDPPRKAERGSGVLSDNSCHMGRGRTS